MSTEDDPLGLAQVGPSVARRMARMLGPSSFAVGAGLVTMGGTRVQRGVGWYLGGVGVALTLYGFLSRASTSGPSADPTLPAPSAVVNLPLPSGWRRVTAATPEQAAHAREVLTSGIPIGTLVEYREPPTPHAAWTEWHAPGVRGVSILVRA